MAHGDYDCCARCDEKQDYNPGGEIAKELVCPGCQVDLKTLLGLTGDNDWIETGAELLEVIKGLEPEQIAALEINKCVFANELDEAIAAKGEGLFAGGNFSTQMAALLRGE